MPWLLGECERASSVKIAMRHASQTIQVGNALTDTSARAVALATEAGLCTHVLRSSPLVFPCQLRRDKWYQRADKRLQRAS